MNQKILCILIYPINVQAYLFALSVSNNEDLSPVVTRPNQSRKQSKREQKHTSNDGINPLTPMSDQDRISPYNINTISSRQVMRLKKISKRKL